MAALAGIYGLTFDLVVDSFVRLKLIDLQAGQSARRAWAEKGLSRMDPRIGRHTLVTGIEATFDLYDTFGGALGSGSI
jgi:hypothetical protein